jgi:hypothetical protein
METKWAFCHGVILSPHGFSESTCKRRERCAYYDEDFYRKHLYHLDEFSEMFPIEPCPYFIAKAGVTERKAEPVNDPF